MNQSKRALNKRTIYRPDKQSLSERVEELVNIGWILQGDVKIH